jgi:hypothetical protein
MAMCVHCRRESDARYPCRECQGPLCETCATEAGLFGVAPILKARAEREKRERILAFTRRPPRPPQ